MGDIFRTCGAAFLERWGRTLSAQQRRALRNIAACRTAALGGHEEACDRCGHRRYAYNSCRNRHCPKCQGTAAARWLDAQLDQLLNVPYFHVVFTLPQVLRHLALQNKRMVYGLLFRAAAETLLQLAAQPKHLGAEIGFLAVLHTWGQNLTHHPHVHCVIPGGGLAPDGTRWVATRRNFFLPVRVLSRVFRGKFLDFLRRAYRRGQLTFHGRLAGLASSAAFETLLDAAVRTDWVVYAKPPFGGPAQVLKYLARYTHRVAISNSRLLAFDGQRVTFRWKDYADGNRQKTMNLDALEFIRRFLQHVLPTGFMRIRRYGFLANRHRQAKLAAIRQLLPTPIPQAQPEPGPAPVTDQDMRIDAATRCPACGEGHLVIAPLQPQAPPPFHWLLPRHCRAGPGRLPDLP